MKSKYNLFQAILLAFIIPFTFTACDDDDKAGRCHYWMISKTRPYRI